MFQSEPPIDLDAPTCHDGAADLDRALGALDPPVADPLERALASDASELPPGALPAAWARAAEALGARVIARLVADLAAEPARLTAALAAWQARVTAVGQRVTDADGLFRRVLEAAPDAMVIVDGDGRIAFVNGETERLFGWEHGELVGEPVEVLVPTHLRHRHVAQREGYTRRPRERAMGAHGGALDLVGRRKDGRELPVEISLSPIETEAGLIVVAAIRDVTGRKATEAAVRRAHLEIAQRAARERAVTEELESFGYAVAHDLRAPVRGITAFAQILAEEHVARLDAEGRDCVAEITANAALMGELIDALLALSRVARAELAPEEVDLGALAAAELARLRAAEPERDVTLVLGSDLEATADPTLARRLVAVLVGNAWKFTSRRARARIEIGREPTAGGHAYFVRDDGAGFDVAFAGGLFLPFQRLHPRTEFPGRGIGLATAKRIVQRHGGIIWAEGTPGRGATFHFTLPLPRDLAATAGPSGASDSTP